MPKLFISYRRADSRKDAGRIYDRLVEAFGKENVFKDLDSIPMGKDFRGILREAVAQCDVQLVIIGKSWLTITDESGNRRLDNPADFVRIEVESALQRDGCLVIPVLVDSTPMPDANDLPLELRELAFKNATAVRDDPDFHADVTKIINALGGKSSNAPKAAVIAFDVHDAISRFYRLFDERDWEAARTLLAEIRASGKAPRVFNVDTHEAEIWEAIEVEERDKEYDVLRLMAHRANSTKLCDALQLFWQNYPGYDPDQLSERCKADEPPSAPSRSRVPDFLPAPFAWIDVPAGEVTLIEDYTDQSYFGKKGDSKTFTVPAFAIAKYPVTNAQFAKFIDAKGYAQKKWWTDAGWQTREKEKWTEPRLWKDKQWNGTNYPVVGVSWYEALAFCAWLSDASGERILLPNEQQWQRAAKGDDGRVYPWGNDWDCSKCKNSVSPCNSNHTSPVTQYEGNGDSPVGVADMAGNVWEWCLTAYQTGKTDVNGTDVRVLRGGSWADDSTHFFRAAFRDRDYPLIRGHDRGFRLALS